MAPSFSERCRQFQRSLTRELIGHRKKVKCLSWSKTGKLASGSADSTAIVWDVDSNIRETEFKGHTDEITCMVWDPMVADRFATASQDKTCKFWDTRIGKVTSSISTPGININMCWHPDGNHVAIGNRDDLICFVDTRKLILTKQTKFKYEVNEIKWNRSGDLFFLTNAMGGVDIYSWPALECVRFQAAHTSVACALDFDRTGQWLAVGSADSLVSMWCLPDLICVHCFEFSDTGLRNLSFSHDSEYIACTAEVPLVYIADVSSGQAIHRITTKVEVTSLQWHPNRLMLAYAGEDRYSGYGNEGVIQLFNVG